MNGIVPTVGKENIGLDLQTLLAGSKVKLFSSNTVIVSATVKADLTEATFTGYTAQTVTAAGDPVIDPINGGISITLPSHQFTTDDPTTVGNTIYGFWLETAAGDLIMAGNFDSPINMTEPFQGIPLMVTLNL
jgi:hypothetical protein